MKLGHPSNNILKLLVSHHSNIFFLLLLLLVMLVLLLNKNVWNILQALVNLFHFLNLSMFIFGVWFQSLPLMDASIFLNIVDYYSKFTSTENQFSCKLKKISSENDKQWRILTNNFGGAKIIHSKFIKLYLIQTPF